MKRLSTSGRFMGLILLALPIHVWSQTSVVTGSSFSMAFGVSTGEDIRVTSAAGEALVGTAEGGDTRAASGFLVILQRQQSALAVDEQAGQPSAYALHPNYPNPFNPSTTLQFDLPVAAEVRIAVYDLLGREVVRLVDQRLEGGYHRLVWNGRDARGREVPTGMYIVLMATPQFRKSIKLVLLK